LVLCSGSWWVLGRFRLGLARGGLWGGLWWVAGWVSVASSGGSHFLWIPMVLGVGFFLLFCFTLLQTHNVEYFPEHFLECKQTLKKIIFPEIICI
jgi:hypothetical protein